MSLVMIIGSHSLTDSKIVREFTLNNIPMGVLAMQHNSDSDTLPQLNFLAITLTFSFDYNFWFLSIDSDRLSHLISSYGHIISQNVLDLAVASISSSCGLVLEN